MAGDSSNVAVDAVGVARHDSAMVVMPPLSKVVSRLIEAIVLLTLAGLVISWTGPGEASPRPPGAPPLPADYLPPPPPPTPPTGPAVTPPALMGTP